MSLHETFADNPKWAIALHGGAGNIPRGMSDDRVQFYKHALSTALRQGVAKLKNGEPALDATQAVVMALEDCPVFNAGRGASFNRAGSHSLDASIMDGRTLATGGVGGVTTLRNPIHGARIVMEQTPHVLFCGPEADALCVKHGAELAPKNYYSVRWRFRKLCDKMREEGLEPPAAPLHGWASDEKSDESLIGLDEEIGGTVGCVALDIHGGLAAATSTGGRNAKMVGRIGDSPIPGAGNYANSSVAVGGTGNGEEFLRYFIAGRMAWLVESKTMSLEEAARHCLEDVLQRGDGGLIAVDHDGNICMRTTTDTLPRAAADSAGRFEVSIWFDD